MGKKDGGAKLSAKEKEAAKKAKKAAKLDKATTKRNKKELKELGEEDIESIIAKFNEKERLRTAVNVTICGQPTPRSNFTMTALPNGEMLLFGGEFCDGVGITVFNELFRWNVEKNEWRQIESLNTPPPRCSHQAVFFKDKVYIFGGEYATLDQFHHYQDMWALDLKTNTWAEITVPNNSAARADRPSPRSGHRMVIWRGYIIMFGGFYEALRDVRWYNDLFFFSFQDERWYSVPVKPHAQVPKPRSGFLMMLHAADDTLYIHGGYSREKKAVSSSGKHTGGKTEGVVHQDTWMINLKPLLGGTGAAAAGAGSSTKGKLDFTKVTWQKVSKKGAVPSTRSGMAILSYKNKGIVFGGVKDEEGHGHSMTSTFYNDLYAFDFDRRRWFQLGLKNKAAVGKSLADAKAAKQAKRAQKAAAAALTATSSKEKSKRSGGRKKRGDDDGEEGGDESGAEDASDSESESESSSSSDDDDEEDGYDVQEDMLANGDFFGYIDESGNVVYVDLNAPDDNPEAATATGSAEMKSTGATDKQEEDSVESVFNMVMLGEGLASSTSSAASESKVSDGTGRAHNGNESKGEEKRAAPAPSISKHSSSATAAAAPMPTGPINLAKYFSSLTEPAPRINAAVCVRGSSTLVVYGGVTELGDIEVTLDDCWTLDLNKRDVWRCVLPGTMHQLQWRGEVDNEDNTSATSAMGSDDDEDDSDSDDEDEDSEDSEEDDGDSDNNVEEGSDEDDKEEEKKKKNKKKDKKEKRAEGEEEPKKSKKKSSSSGDAATATAADAEGQSCGLRKATRDRSGLHGSRGAGGVMAELHALRLQLPNEGSEDENPLPSESLREFFGRTTVFWKQQAVLDWQRKQGAGDSGSSASASGDVDTLMQQRAPKVATRYGREVDEDNNGTSTSAGIVPSSAIEIHEALSEKDIKRIAFELADIRFKEAEPIMAAMRELEEQVGGDDRPGPLRSASGRGGSSGHGHSSSSGKKSSSGDKEKSGSKKSSDKKR